MRPVPAIVERIPSAGQRLAECERRIEAGFVEAGRAFREIRDERLYPSEYGSGGFDAYCLERWGLSRRRVDYLISSAEVDANLRTNGSEVLPTSERQVRPLARLEPEQQVTAWNRAVESAGDRRVTARHVEAAVAELYPRRDEPDAWEDNPSLRVEPARPALPGQSELPLEPEIIVEAPPVDRNAERWGEIVQHINTFFVSLPRRGGIPALLSKWPMPRRRAFVDYLKEARDRFDAAIAEAERMTR